MFDIVHTGLGIEISADVLATLNRVVLGTFFCTSGYHKLFNEQRHASLVETLTTNKVPYVGVNQWFVPMVEFCGGMALIPGLLSPLAAFGLFSICLVATITDGLKRIPSWNPIDRADWLCCLFYLPEVCYLVMLGFVIDRPGRYSLDHVIISYDLNRQFGWLFAATVVTGVFGALLFSGRIVVNNRRFSW